MIRVKGMKDKLGEEMKLWQLILNKIRDTLTHFGFEEIQTPALEYIETLEKERTLGEENKKDIFRLKDKSGRNLGLRFDMTVPVVRVFSNKVIPHNTKIFYISNMWRYEQPQRGRLREFWQFGIEILNSKNSSLSDCDTIVILHTILKKLKVKNFTFKINSRKILDKIVERHSIYNKQKFITFFDKRDKMEKETWNKELLQFLKKEDKLYTILTDNNAEDSKKYFSDHYKEEFSKIEEIIKLCQICGVPKEIIQFYPTLARGLEYYTDFIFETILKNDISFGSLGSGGRYDKLLTSSKKEFVNATGFAAGIERIFEVSQLTLPKLKPKICLISTSEKHLPKLLKIRTKLIENSINATLSDFFNIKKSLEKYSKNHNFCIIIGDRETKNNTLTLKDLEKGEQKEISKLEELIKFVKKSPQP